MDVLFWSGGKDAWLALTYYRATHANPLSLLTTFREDTGAVPFQEIAISEIRTQAKALELELIEVPLPPSPSNDRYLELVIGALNAEADIQTLVFGDWHLEDIRSWREDVFGTEGYHCLFPIWKRPVGELLDRLEEAALEVRINAVAEDYSEAISVGDRFDRSFVEQLPEGIDPMGEHGEFHTRLLL